MEKLKLILLWATKIVISGLFILASLGKLSSSETVIQMFREWGYMDGFYFYVGVLELILAILVLIPRTSLHAAILLFLVMIGALITHLLHDPFLEIIRPLVFMGLLSVVIYSHWDKGLFVFKRT